MSANLMPDSYYELFAIDDDGRIFTTIMSLLEDGRHASLSNSPVSAGRAEGAPLMTVAYDIAVTLLPEIWARAQENKSIAIARSQS